MELWLPEQLALSETARELIADVEQTARRVNSLRPLPADVVHRIEDELLGDRVYSSNAIEGNTLDRRETVMVLKQGIDSVSRRREATEARNLGEAVQRVAELVSDPAGSHRKECLLDVHRMILREVDDDRAGRFRDRRVMIQGAKHQPPDHALVPALVDRVLEKLGSGAEVSRVVLGTWAHWALARIHPFFDGNGRMARLWQDLVLLQGGLTCAIVRPEDRRAYLDALGEADEGNFEALLCYVARSVSRTFDKYLVELDRVEELDGFVRELVGEADARAAEKRKLSYLRWSRKMEQLRWEFEACAARISEASAEVKVQVKGYEIIDEQRWENIRLGRPVTKNWHMIVDFYRGSVHRGYCFFFGKHFWTADLDNAADRSEQRVCLLVSEFQDNENGKSAVRLKDDPFVSLREIFVIEDRFVRKRMDRSTGKDVYDRDVAALDIAKDFIREVILHRLT